MLVASPIFHHKQLGWPGGILKLYLEHVPAHYMKIIDHFVWYHLVYVLCSKLGLAQVRSLTQLFIGVAPELVYLSQSGILFYAVWIQTYPFVLHVSLLEAGPGFLISYGVASVLLLQG